jgi:hypothetical protein
MPWELEFPVMRANKLLLVESYISTNKVVLQLLLSGNLFSGYTTSDMIQLPSSDSPGLAELSELLEPPESITVTDVSTSDNTLPACKLPSKETITPATEIDESISNPSIKVRNLRIHKNM